MTALHRRPKILVVSPTPPPFSGPEVMTQWLLQSPLREEFELLHFNIGKEREVETKGSFDLINLFYGLVQPVILAYLILRDHPQIVYTNLAQNLAGFLRYASFVLVARLYGRKVVVRVMGSGFEHFYARAPGWLKAFIRYVIAQIDLFILRGHGLISQFAGIAPEGKCRVVYSGIDPHEFAGPPCSKPEQATDDCVRVLFVGYLSHAKGAIDLLRTVPLVVSQAPQVRFMLAGSRLKVEKNITFIDNPPDNEAMIAQLLQNDQIRQHVEFLGAITGPAKIKAFRSADIFILPSYSEAFPTVVLEAMAAGLPVVATPVGALPEVFGAESIIYIPPGDCQAIAQALLRLIRDPELRRRMGRRNREIVGKYFNLQTYAYQLSQIFRELTS